MIYPHTPPVEYIKREIVYVMQALTQPTMKIILLITGLTNGAAII